MGYRVDPHLVKDVERFGGGEININKCFNCGNCTAVCALSEGNTVFPRKIIRYLQLGLRDKLLESPEPWLCYYCGECSGTCPREAQPGELMMATRRWLTSEYDLWGLSKKLYLSTTWEVGLLIVGALVVLALFIVPGMFGAQFGFQMVQGEAAQHVRVNTFAPKEIVHYGDWALAAGLVLFLGINFFRMIYFFFRGKKGIYVPFSLWFTKLPELFIHFMTQKRWLKCEQSPRLRWLEHLLLMTGYGTMFMLVVVFLRTFQRDGAEFHWTALLGYYATLTLLGATWLAIRSRLRKEDQIHKFSHHTDWMFLVLLFLTALSGLILNLFRLLDLPWPTYIFYVLHLMIAVPMLVIEVPFGKWTHLVFRPVSFYLLAVRGAAIDRKVVKVGATRPVPV